MVEKIPFFRPSIGQEEKDAVLKVLDTGWLAEGQVVRDFENNLSKYLNSKTVMATNSCTSALFISLKGLGIGPGDEVITTPLTFTATANVIVQCGAKPILVDIEEDTFNINPKKIKKKITDKTKVIMPVHYAGASCNMDEINSFGIPVIEDAAHALGAEYKERKVGDSSNLVCFSFYATKNITTGDGGCISTNRSDEIIEKIKVLKSHGLSKSAWQRVSGLRMHYYDVIDAGYKMNMTNIEAAIGIEQLKKAEQFMNSRRKIASYFDKELADFVITHIIRPYNVTARHLYPIRVKNIERDIFINKMKEKGVQCSLHFVPIYKHKFYRDNFNYDIKEFKITEKIFSNIVSLPLFPSMTKREMDYIIDSVRGVIYENDS